MKTLFGNETIVDKEQISLEMIDVQKNDPLIDNLVTEIEKLEELYLSAPKRFKAGVSFMTNQETKAIIKKIDILLSDRFGIKFKYINYEDTLFATIPVSPLNPNVLTENNQEIYDMAATLKGGQNGSDSNPDDMIDVETDEANLYKNIYKSFNELEKQMRTDKVTIDWKKAKISNLPKDYHVYLLGNYKLGFDLKLTPIEIAAILLHEVGHAFTHLSYSYRTVKNTSVLVNTLHDSYSKKKDFSKTLDIVYEKDLNGDVRDIKGADITTKVLRVFDRFSEINDNMDSSNHYSSIDSEQLADQFAGRFGVGQHLSSGLAKVTIEWRRPIKTLEYTFQFMVQTAMYMFLSGLILEALAALIIGPFIATFIIIPLLTRVVDLVFAGPSDETYDETIKRLERIRLETIRQLRTLDMDKKDKKKLIEGQNAVMLDMRKLGPDDKRFTEVLAYTFKVWNRGKEKRIRLDMLLEQLMENDLHVAKAKLEVQQ